MDRNIKTSLICIESLFQQTDIVGKTDSLYVRMASIPTKGLFFYIMQIRNIKTIMFVNLY